MITNTITARRGRRLPHRDRGASSAAPVHAAAADYRFEVAEVKPAGTGKSDVTLRLIHTPDKKAGDRMPSFFRSRPIWDRTACRR